MKAIATVRSCPCSLTYAQNETSGTASDSSAQSVDEAYRTSQSVRSSRGQRVSQARTTKLPTLRKPVELSLTLVPNAVDPSFRPAEELDCADLGEKLLQRGAAAVPGSLTFASDTHSDLADEIIALNATVRRRARVRGTRGAP